MKATSLPVWHLARLATDALDVFAVASVGPGGSTFPGMSPAIPVLVGIHLSFSFRTYCSPN